MPITLAAKHLHQNSINLAVTVAQNTFHENTKNLAFQNCGNHTGSKTLSENIKNPALTNPTYIVASHIAGITKSGNAKFWQLH